MPSKTTPPASTAGRKTPSSAGQGAHAIDGIFEAVFHASPNGMCLVRRSDAAVVAVNEAWLQTTGVARAAAMQGGLAAFGASIANALAGGVEAGVGSDANGRSHLPIWVSLVVSGNVVARRMPLYASEVPFGDEQLHLLTLGGETSTPLAQRPEAAREADAQAQASLVQQQAQLLPAIENLARVGHWIASTIDHHVVWSQGLYEIAGLEPRALVSHTDGRVGIHADDQLAWLAARDRLDGKELEYRWTRPNGTVRWLRSRMGRTELADRGFVEFGVIQDITDEIEAKKALADQLELLNNIAEHVPGAIYQARRRPDGTSVVTYLSNPATEVLELSVTVVGKDQRVFFQRVVPEDIPPILASLERSINELSTMKCTFRIDLPKRGRRWIEVEASTRREADGDVVWDGFITDVTDRLQAGKALERQHRMLQAIQKSQSTFIGVEDKGKAFEGLLASFLSVTDSAFGFVGEVLLDAQEQPYLRMHALTNIAWDDATRRRVELGAANGVEFRKLDSLFGHALRTGETVVSNNPAEDPRSGGLPPGHPPIHSFMGLPIELNGKLVAMVGLANRPDGFDSDDVEFLKPLLGTVRELVMATRAHAERVRSRLQFQATSDLLAKKSAALQATFDSISQGLTMVDAEGKVRFYNQRMLELLDFPESLLQNEPHYLDVFKFQEERRDFGDELKMLPPTLLSHLRDGQLPPQEKYVRATNAGKMLEVVTRMLPAGGFVRTYTDVTSYLDAQEALRKERQRLQWVLEATRPGIWENNLETKETHYSERWANMLGYSLSEISPRTAHTWKGLVHPDDLPRAMRNVELHIAGELPYYECDLRMRHKNGSWLWVNDRGRVHRRDADGKALYMSGTLLDIHDRVAAQEEVRSLNDSLERRVVERTAALERSMKDMETISYSIAHDLRAPLRSVNGFASLIAEEEGERLSAEALEMFKRIARSSRNMGQMITDMLELLRVVRVDLQAVAVDMDQLAHSVKESLAPGTPHALIDIKPLPTVMGDATLLRQVLVNLMDNALKYARHRTQPELVLGFDEEQRAFYLRDNGMGFDMARAGKLFGLFQRMHSDSEVPGTGVGLAIVARIVERHGGRIWADAIPGEGATFWWTLPKE